MSLGVPQAEAQEGEYDFSWLDPEKKIYVVQNRKFLKEGNLNIGFSLGSNINGTYNEIYGFQPRATYFFTENFGIEFFYLSGSNSTNNLYDEAVSLEARPLVRDLDSLLGVELRWAPFYGKINTFNRIIYFDWMFGVGLGQSTTSTNKCHFKDKNSPSTSLFCPDTQTQILEESFSTFLGSTGLRFHLSRNWSVWTELKLSGYQAKGVFNEEDRWFNNHFILVGVHYAL
jgi:outer membrane beta-barrel protein